jgi:hypothetical protein
MNILTNVRSTHSQQWNTTSQQNVVMEGVVNEAKQGRPEREMQWERDAWTGEREQQRLARLEQERLDRGGLRDSSLKDLSMERLAQERLEQERLARLD